MATATKHMTHFNSAADGFIELEGKASGFAEELFIGLSALAEEFSGKDLIAEFDKAMIDVENARKETLVKLTGDNSITLSKYSPAWRVRKSELRKGVKAGLDPTKYETFAKFRKATDKATNSNASGTNTGASGGSSNKSGGADNKGPSTGNTPAVLHSVTSNLPKAVADKLNLIAKHLVDLDEKAALEILTNCDGAIHARLKKVGGRYGNVKQKTG